MEPGGPDRICVSGDLVVAGGDIDLTLIDVADPEAPRMISTRDDGHAWDLAWRGSLGLSSRHWAVDVLRWNGDREVRQLAQFSVGSALGNVEIIGDLGVVTSEDGEAVVFFDLVDPEHPAVVRSFDVEEFNVPGFDGLGDITVADPVVLVGNNRNAFIFAVGTDGMPELLLSYPLLHGARGIVLSDDRLLILNGWSLWISPPIALPSNDPRMVRIDVSPGDAANEVDCSDGSGFVEVAIMGEVNFEVTLVDAESLCFGPARGPLARTVGGSPFYRIRDVD